jgi:hypothetical protein
VAGGPGMGMMGRISLRYFSEKYGETEGAIGQLVRRYAVLAQEPDRPLASVEAARD